MPWIARFSVLAVSMLGLVRSAAADERSPVRPLSLDYVFFDASSRSTLHIQQAFGTIRWRDGARRVAFHVPSPFVSASYGLGQLGRSGPGLPAADRPAARPVPPWDRGTMPAPEAPGLAWMLALDLARPSVGQGEAIGDPALRRWPEAGEPGWQRSYGPLLVRSLLRLQDAPGKRFAAELWDRRRF